MKAIEDRCKQLNQLHANIVQAEKELAIKKRLPKEQMVDQCHLPTQPKTDHLNNMSNENMVLHQHQVTTTATNSSNSAKIMTITKHYDETWHLNQIQHHLCVQQKTMMQFFYMLQ